MTEGVIVFCVKLYLRAPAIRWNTKKPSAGLAPISSNRPPVAGRSLDSKLPISERPNPVDRTEPSLALTCIQRPETLKQSSLLLSAKRYKNGLSLGQTRVRKHIESAR